MRTNYDVAIWAREQSDERLRQCLYVAYDVLNGQYMNPETLRQYKDRIRIFQDELNFRDATY